MKLPNPFANPAARLRTGDDGPAHASDHPGRDYDECEPRPGGASRSSGPGGPSEPRRPGTGERQAPRRECEDELKDSDPLIPGEVLLGRADVEINAGLDVTTIRVANGADRPIQVGSHFHFAEVNAALEFDRAAAWGKRLNVLSGGSVRFEPGAVEEVELVPIQGQRVVLGLRGLCKGRLDERRPR